jgi:hypothetical protein
LGMLLFLFLYSLDRIKQNKEHLFLFICQTQVKIIIQEFRWFVEERII